MVEREKEQNPDSAAKIAELKEMLKLAEMQEQNFKKLVENEHIKIADVGKNISKLEKNSKSVQVVRE